MAWASPVIHAVGDVLTASDWNINSRDLSFVAGTTAATLFTQQSTTSTTYTDLATVGPTLTLTTGANAIVAIGTWASNTTNGCYASWTVSGATTTAAADAWSVEIPVLGGGSASQCSFMSVASLNPGSNTFTMKYRVNSGTGNFANRYLIVWPLP